MHNVYALYERRKSLGLGLGRFLPKTTKEQILSSRMAGFYADLTFDVLRALLQDVVGPQLGAPSCSPSKFIKLSSHSILKYACVHVYVYIYFYIEYVMVSILYEL